MPPASNGIEWCTAIHDAESVAFFTSPVMGQTFATRPDDRVLLDTVFLGVLTLVTAKPLESQSDLEAFARQWVGNGMYQHYDAAYGLPIADLAAADARYRTLSSSVAPAPSRIEQCVEYSRVGTEHNDSAPERGVLEQHDRGILCRLPSKANMLVLAGLSERFLQGAPVDPTFFDHLDKEFNTPFSASLRFR
ncbi:hypothetical protein HQ394_10750 [Defluviicoccus vanus]|uniref:Uncharacterized protein n=2 Tax=Defluviicoccus vanus TaxID=111831 RepID=A0A7H1N1X9_9PROT|nr:hypothetical protein HQ394_10750 [Defluviicoccus vanus]